MTAARGGPAAPPRTPSPEPREVAAPWAPIPGILAVLAISLVPRVADVPALQRSFWGAAAVLVLWQAALLLRPALRPAGGLSLVLARPRPQHWVQSLVQLSVYAYWGFYWRPVYEYAWLLVAQLAFAYAFDVLLSWTRGRGYTLGFGPLPIILSTNLFLWFRDDWFFLQFLLVGVGFLGKELVRWTRDGRRVHIFNPSAFSLGVFSVALIATGTTHLTWGQEIATTLSLAPFVYSWLFVGGLVVMYFFRVTLVAAGAAAALFALGGAYEAVTGVPYFLDSAIPSAVFLGLHLLVTDPSTSPRTPLGKAAFGALYGMSVFALYSVLGWMGAPTFYDKLLCVPLLNLAVRQIDTWVQRVRLRPGRAAWTAVGVPPRMNLAHMGLWVALFGGMSALGRTDGRHTGDSVPFWEQACAEGRPTACDRLVQLETTYCGDGAGWACNELGVHFASGGLVDTDAARALEHFSRACELRFQAGCLNALDPGAGTRAPPRALDLRLLLREGGRNLVDMPERDLYLRACDHRWTFACERVGVTG